ncbi:hypothetical protein [Sphingomonas alpina]|nr:hypothetical protein [Sphingomonas alpina]
MPAIPVRNIIPAAEPVIEPVAGTDDDPTPKLGDAMIGADIGPGTDERTASDPGVARRRLTMQIYTRMMTDLTVLTGGTRLPTDEEIDDALNRAARAHGLRSRASARRQVAPQLPVSDPLPQGDAIPASVFWAGLTNMASLAQPTGNDLAPDHQITSPGLRLDEAMLRSIDDAAAIENDDTGTEATSPAQGGAARNPRDLVSPGPNGSGDIATAFLRRAENPDAPDWLENHISEFSLEPTVENFTNSGDFDRIAAVRDQARAYAQADQTRTNTRQFADRLTQWLDERGYGPDIVITANPRRNTVVTDSDAALGALSSHYETGGRGPGTISTGQGDAGGISYGSYQLSTNKGMAKKFVESREAKAWAEKFRGLTPGTPAFSKRWREIAVRDRDTFQAAQHAFILKTHYSPVVAAIRAKKKDGLNFNSRSQAVRNAVWSAAVQHGGAVRFLNRAVNATDAAFLRTDPGYDAALIDNIYDARIAYVTAERNRQANVANLERRPDKKNKLQGQVKQLTDVIKNRYPSERAAAQQMLRDERRRAARVP